MTTSIDNQLFVAKTEDETFGIRQGNAGEDAPEGYVSRSALKALVRAALDAKGEPFVVSAEVAEAAGRANLELMAQANKAGMAGQLIAMAASFTADAATVLQTDVDVDQFIAEINEQREANGIV